MTYGLGDGSLFRLWHQGGERIELDIGCSTGRFLIRLARHSPRAHIVGVDIRCRCVTEAEHHIAASGIPNAYAIECEAVAFLSDPRIVPESAISVIHVYFPTPDSSFVGLDEPLLRPAFFKSAARVIHRGGLLRIATDDIDVYDTALKHVPYHVWQPVDWHRLDIGLQPRQMVGSPGERNYLVDPQSELGLLQLRRR